MKNETLCFSVTLLSTYQTIHRWLYGPLLGPEHFYFSVSYATSRKVGESIPDEVTGFFNWPNASSRTMALGPTQPLTEFNTRNLLGGKGRPTRKTDDLTAICEQIV
jgi:hypothetical protein